MKYSSAKYYCLKYKTIYIQEQSMCVIQDYWHQSNAHIAKLLCILCMCFIFEYIQLSMHYSSVSVAIGWCTWRTLKHRPCKTAAQWQNVRTKQFLNAISHCSGYVVQAIEISLSAKGTFDFIFLFCFPVGLTATAPVEIVRSHERYIVNKLDRALLQFALTH